MTILAIETSCDETAAAVYSTQTGIRSSVLFSQIELHRRFGGVVPEIASRSHLEKISPIVTEACEQAQCDFNEIDTIAVTNRPGLPGSLLIGLAYAKALAYAHKKQLVAVNHIEGHVFSSFLEFSPPFPHLCLTASGGHTSLYRVDAYGSYREIGTTLDDAAGEAFDKVAKLMNLGYPGGPIIEKLAQKAAFQDVFKYPRLKQKTLDFSFSGLKTAVLYDLVKRGAYDLHAKKFLAPGDEKLASEVSSSFLTCMADIFIDRLERARREHDDIRAVTFVGGVACNQFLAQNITQWADSKKLACYVPSRRFCTDNAAMIAFVGHYRAQAGLFADYTLDLF